MPPGIGYGRGRGRGRKMGLLKDKLRGMQGGSRRERPVRGSKVDRPSARAVPGRGGMGSLKAAMRSRGGGGGRKLPLGGREFAQQVNQSPESRFANRGGRPMGALKGLAGLVGGGRGNMRRGFRSLRGGGRALGRLGGNMGRGRRKRMRGFGRAASRAFGRR